MWRILTIIEFAEYQPLARKYVRMAGGALGLIFVAVLLAGRGKTVPSLFVLQAVPRISFVWDRICAPVSQGLPAQHVILLFVLRPVTMKESVPLRTPAPAPQDGLIVTAPRPYAPRPVVTEATALPLRSVAVPLTGQALIAAPQCVRKLVRMEDCALPPTLASARLNGQGQTALLPSVPRASSLPISRVLIHICTLPVLH